MKVWKKFKHLRGVHPIDISSLELEQLDENVPWFIVIEHPDKVRDQLEISYTDELEELGEDLVPFAVITGEGQKKLGKFQPETMLFFDLEEGDVEDCPIRVCYSDDFDADFVCDTVETLLSCIKK